MNATSAIVYCRRCRSRLRLPSGKGRFACPKCGTAVVPAPAEPASRVPNPPPPPPAAARPANALARVAGPPNAAPDVSFRQYRQAHYRQTRGLAVYGFCAGLLLAPVISLAKPFLGIMGLLGVWVATVLLWAGLGALYGAERLVEYRILRRRTVPVDAGSWTAACVFGLFVALAPVSAVVVLEAFSPPQGMLATLVPAFQEEQQRWLPAVESVDATVIQTALSPAPAGPHTAERLPGPPSGSAPRMEKAPPSLPRSVSGETGQMPSALADRVPQFREARGLGRPALPSPREWLESLREEVAPSRAVAVETAKESVPVARRWALAIGVNRYQDPQIPGLEYAVADARLVRKTLAEQCGYPADRILLLADDQPTEDRRPGLGAIRKQLAAWLERADSEDTMFVFFSGHAFLDGEGRCYLAPSDARKADLIRSSLSTDELRNLLARCKATQKVLVLDCCHAGGTKAADSAAVSAEEAAKALAESAGLVTLASCRKAESSHEWKAQGQGLFTYFLCRGLQGEADHDGNGLVDIDELYRYTFTEVPTVARRELRTRQTPARCYPPDSVGVITLASVRLDPARPGATPSVNATSMRQGSAGRSSRSEAAKPMRPASDDPYRDISLLCDQARQHHERGDRGLALATIVQAHRLAADTKAGHLKDRLLEALSRTQNEIDDVAGADESARLIKDPFRQASISKQNALARARRGDYEAAFVFAEEERLVADLALAAAKAGEFETAKAGLSEIGEWPYTRNALPLYEPTLRKIEDLEARSGGSATFHRPVSPFASRSSSGGSRDSTTQQSSSNLVLDPLCRVWDLCTRAVAAHALGEKRLAITVITEARDVAEEIKTPYPRDLAHELLALAFYDLGDLAGVSSEAHAIQKATRKVLVLVLLAKIEWAAKNYVNAWELVRSMSHGRMEYFIAELAVDVARTGQIELARTILEEIGSKPMKNASRQYDPALRKIKAEAARFAGPEPPPRER